MVCQMCSLPISVPVGVAAPVGRALVLSQEVTWLVVAGPGEAVEVGDVLASPCELCRVVAGGDVRRPLVDHRGEGFGAAGGDGGVAGAGVPVDTGRHGPGSQLRESGALRGVGLPDVFIEIGRASCRERVCQYV